MRRTSLPAIALVAAVFSLACAPDLTLPNGGKGMKLTCASDADCPSPLFCSAAGRCVPTRDDVPPDLAGEPEVTPKRGRAQTAFTIAFGVTEKLGQPPRVSLGLATPTDVPCTEDAPNHWNCPWKASGEENEKHGGVVPVRIGLVDEFGLTATKDNAATLTLDFDPPTAAAHAVQPAIARLGAEIQLFVTFSEELGGTEPVAKCSVPLAEPGGPTTALKLEREPGTLNYRGHHVVTAGDPEGDVQFTVEAQDRVENPSGPLDLGTVRIDTEQPVVSDGVVTPAFAKDGKILEARFTLSKPPVADPRVTAGGLPLERDPTVDAPAYRYTRTVHEADGAGVRAVIVEAMDAAGNTVVQSIGTVEFDFTPPRLLSAGASPSRARLGDEVLVSLQPSEPLGEPPTIALEPATAPAFALVPNTAWAFSHRVSTSDGTGTYTARFHLVDRAGNEADEEAPEEFLIDANPPEISSLSVNAARFSRQPGFDHVVVTFHLSEPLTELPAELVATLGGRVLTCAPSSDGLDVTCASDVLAAGEEGSQRVLVTARDAAGNVAFESTPVEFDFTAPKLVAASVTPSPARTGDLVAYTVTADEPLASAPVLSATPPLAFSAVSGTTWVLQRRLDGTEAEGSHELRIDLVDRVGNAATGLAGVPVVLDSTAPKVSALDAKPARVPAGGTVTATFVLDDALAASALSVLLAGKAMHCDATTGVTNGWTCTRTLEADEAPAEAETPADVVVQARDGAGNVGSASTRIVFDLRAPDLVPGSDALVLVPTAANVVRAPTAVTTGTVVRLSFALDESVDPATPPQVTARLGTEELAFAKAAVAGNTWVFEHQVQGATEGEWALELAVADAAGNRRTIHPPAGSFTVDTTAPTAPDVGTADRVTYTRVPWGSDATSGLAKFTLTGAAQASQAGLVLAYDGPSPDTANEIGRALAAEDGSFGPMNLARADRRLVYVATADAAGNLSQTAAVKDVTWIATLRGKVAGSTIENPHRVQVIPSVSLTRLAQDPALTSEPDASALGTADGNVLKESTEPLWNPRPVTKTGPSGRYGAQLAYDAIRGRTVLWGGRYYTVDSGGNKTVGDFASDTWEWDGDQWIDTTPASGGPQGRENFALTWDAGRGRVVLVGGFRAYQGGGLYDDLWEYDGASWRQIFPSGSWPKGRANAIITYDALRRTTLLIGGTDKDGAHADVWSWNGTTWTLLGAAPYLFSGTAAFDTTRLTLVVHGQTANGAETWELSPLGLWSKKASGSGIPGADDSSLAFDGLTHQMLLFGKGGELWTWNGTTWTFVKPLGGPPGRSMAALAPQANGGDVLFGGTAPADTWTWTGAAWRDMTPTGLAPAARASHGMAFDPSTRQTWLTGGRSYSFNTTEPVPDDTWTWDGWRWRLAMASGGPGLSRGVMLYSPLDGLLWTGGNYQGTAMSQFYLYFGTWFDLAPYLNPTPPRRDSHGAVVNATTGELIVFGGFAGGHPSDETWIFNGSAWRNATGPAGTNPVGRFDTAMAWDAVRQKAVLFGGVYEAQPTVMKSIGDTWEFDGTTWTEKTGLTTAPPAREGATMAWDAARQRVVLVGGITDDGVVDDVWEWDGTQWTERTPPRPQQRSFADHAMAYDSVRQRMVVNGGQGTVLIPGDTYELQDDPNMRPGVLAAFDWSASGEAASTVQSTSLVVTAGGTGADTAGTAAPGAIVGTWDTGLALWASRGSTDAAVSGPKTVTWDVTNPSLAQRSFLGGRTMHVLVIPKSGQGVTTGHGTVAVDYVELKVKYRR